MSVKEPSLLLRLPAVHGQSFPFLFCGHFDCRAKQAIMFQQRDNALGDELRDNPQINRLKNSQKTSKCAVVGNPFVHQFQ